MPEGMRGSVLRHSCGRRAKSAVVLSESGRNTQDQSLRQETQEQETPLLTKEEKEGTVNPYLIDFRLFADAPR